MSTLDKGSVIADRYVVKSILGKGGMGMVFLVTDKKSGIDMALKTLLAKYSDSFKAQARFVREVRLLKRLNHPGIMKIYDAQKWENTLFYVMEYVNGKTLRLCLRENGKFSFTATVQILSLVANALEHAHELTIHRDLAPENIMLLPDGSIRLLDFGLAKFDDKFKDLTSVGSNLGRIDYMAPEQQKNAANIDKRADIYPLGIIFFEMLTGRRPKFNERITDFCPEIPYEANAFMAKATAPNPDDRFPSATAFRDELLRIQKIARGEIASQAKWWQKPMILKLINRFKR